MRRALVVLALGLACFLAPMAAAYGLWSTTATGTMTVTTAGPPPPAPAAPTLSCGSSPGTGQFTITWPAVSGATTSYTIYRSTTTNAPAEYASFVPNATSPYTTVAPAGQSTVFYRLKAQNDTGESGYSNTLRVVRSGSSTTCSGVTP